MRTLAAVTTFNASGYELYGRKMVETFLQHWPSNVQLYLYAEGFSPDIPSPRIIHRDLLADCPELVAFKARHANNPAAHGNLPQPQWKIRLKARMPWLHIRRVQRGLGFHWDAVRFSHKSFSIFSAARSCNADVLFWIDGDTLFFNNIPSDFLESLTPPGVLLSFLARKSHSECGFVGYNLRHPAIENFFAQFEQLYTSDSLFREREFHDSYLFDVVRKRFERSGCKTYDIGEGIGQQANHVLVNSKLGEYMDHLKGDRKIEGKSFRDDLIVARQESHWSKQNSLPFQ